MQNFCPHFARIATAQDETRFLIARLRCKRWSCEYCADKNRSIWRARIIDAVNKNPAPWHFVTLTAHEKQRGVDRSLDNLRFGWQKLNCRIRRKFDKFHYVRVMELHSDESIHWHFIASIPFDDVFFPEAGAPYSRWLKDNARSCGLGYMVHAEPLNGHAGFVASYITKYLTKGLSDVNKKTTAIVRVIQASQKFLTDDYNPPAKYSWQVRTRLTEHELFNRWGRGIEIFDISTNQVVTTDDIITSNVYPPIIAIETKD